MAAQAKAMHALIDEGSGGGAGSAARYLLDIYRVLTQEAPPNEILILRLSRAADDARLACLAAAIEGTEAVMAYEQAVSARGGGVIAALLETPRKVAAEALRQDLDWTIRKSRRAERHL